MVLYINSYYNAVSWNYFSMTWKKICTPDYFFRLDDAAEVVRLYHILNPEVKSAEAVKKQMNISAKKLIMVGSVHAFMICTQGSFWAWAQPTRDFSYIVT